MMFLEVHGCCERIYFMICRVLSASAAVVRW